MKGGTTYGDDLDEEDGQSYESHSRRDKGRKRNPKAAEPVSRAVHGIYRSHVKGEKIKNVLYKDSNDNAVQIHTDMYRRNCEMT
jgi:hypothetical protein